MESIVRTVAIHLGICLQSLITFLQLPADVAYRRTIQSIQAANTATINMILNIFRSMLDSINAFFCSIRDAITGFVLVCYSAVHNFITSTLDTVITSLSFNYYAIVHDFIVATATKSYNNLITIRETAFDLINKYNTLATSLIKQNFNLLVLFTSSTIFGLLIGLLISGNNTDGSKTLITRRRRHLASTIILLSSLLTGILFLYSDQIPPLPLWTTTLLSSIHSANKSTFNFLTTTIYTHWKSTAATRQIRREKLVQFLKPLLPAVIKWINTNLKPDPTTSLNHQSIMVSLTEKLAVNFPSAPASPLSSLGQSSDSIESLLEFSSTSGQITGWILTAGLMTCFEVIISFIRQKRLEQQQPTKTIKKSSSRLSFSGLIPRRRKREESKEENEGVQVPVATSKSNNSGRLRGWLLPSSTKQKIG
ncbi:hypothetical protein QBC38DRAFT_452735 [Podospora fimiseda]|uniref:Uncharacterized protein n=1 Tax=Podospora fimiseda TaxID=252190 RepID=A0AAN7BUN4_9PEZI|nr:hypothetical protein QBC38DRAFT_452735 [Podospora fimiseda]